MKLSYLEQPTEKWFERIPASEEHPRSWITIVDIEVEMSDGRILKREKGVVWDGASVPRWAWWIFSPIDEGAFGDWLHDELWTDKKTELEHFGYNIYKARKFADKERIKWRKSHAPGKWIFNFVSEKVIRLVGGFYYSRQKNIPK